jgi:hypothetical protein
MRRCRSAKARAAAAGRAAHCPRSRYRTLERIARCSDAARYRQQRQDDDRALARRDRGCRGTVTRATAAPRVSWSAARPSCSAITRAPMARAPFCGTRVSRLRFSRPHAAASPARPRLGGRRCRDHHQHQSGSSRRIRRRRRRGPCRNEIVVAHALGGRHADPQRRRPGALARARSTAARGTRAARCSRPTMIIRRSSSAGARRRQHLRRARRGTADASPSGQESRLGESPRCR